MQVVGITTQQYVYVASRERKFKINEILILDDAEHAYPKGEVVESQSFNRYIPLTTEKNGLVDDRVLRGLRQVGFQIEDEQVNLAKVRLLTELAAPIQVGVGVRIPTFDEVEDILVRTYPDQGLVLGVIQGSGDVTVGMPEQLQDTAYLFTKEGGMQEQGGVPFIFDYRAMDQYPHIGIFGGSGSGKSFGLRVLLEELMKKGVPAVVFDPHFEMSFHTPFPNLPLGYQEEFADRYAVFSAGQEVGIDFTELSASDLVNLLKASSGGFTEGMDNAVRSIHANRDSLASFSSRLSRLVEALDNEVEIKRFRSGNSELEPRQRQRLEEMEELLLKYKDKVGHNSSLKGISWRLNRLQQAGIFVGGIGPIESALHQRKLVVIRGSLWFLQVFAHYVTRKLYDQRRQYRDAIQKGLSTGQPFPPFVVITDEAHNFAPKGSDSAAKGVLKEIAQEGRKYGVFLVFATQRPALLDDTITAQLNTKVVFRTVRSTDIQVIREETDLSGEEAQRLPYLPSGSAFVSSAIWGRTVAVRVRVAKTTSPHALNPFDELDQTFQAQEDSLFEVLTGMFPINPANLNSCLQDIQKKLGKTITCQEIIAFLEAQVKKGRVAKEPSPFGPIYQNNPS